MRVANYTLHYFADEMEVVAFLTVMNKVIRLETELKTFYGYSVAALFFSMSFHSSGMAIEAFSSICIANGTLIGRYGASL